MQPLPYHPAYPGPRRRRSLWPLVPVALVGLFLLFQCSGLHFPMWDPGSNLSARLSKDLGLTLPASAKVTRGVREAQRDPAEYYVIEMPAGDAAAFIAKLRPVAEVPLTPNPAQATYRIPDWWTPGKLPNMKALECSREQAVYRWFYSDSNGTIYLAWLAF